MAMAAKVQTLTLSFDEACEACDRKYFCEVHSHNQASASLLPVWGGPKNFACRPSNPLGPAAASAKDKQQPGWNTEWFRQWHSHLTMVKDKDDQLLRPTMPKAVVYFDCPQQSILIIKRC